MTREPEFVKASAKIVREGRKDGNFQEMFDNLTEDRSETFKKRVAKDTVRCIDSIWSHEDDIHCLGEEARDFYDEMHKGLFFGFEA